MTTSFQLYSIGDQKKCIENLNANAEGIIAIAHDDDLQLIESKDQVRPSLLSTGLAFKLIQ